MGKQVFSKYEKILLAGLALRQKTFGMVSVVICGNVEYSRIYAIEVYRMCMILYTHPIPADLN